MKKINMIKKATAFLAAATCLFSTGTTLTNASAASEMVNYRTSSNYFEKKLSGNDLILYNNLLSSCQKVDSNYKKTYEYTPGAKFIVDGNSEEDFNKAAKKAQEIFYLFVLDHPEFYWISTNFEVGSSGGAYISALVDPAYRNGPARKKAAEQIESAVAPYVAGAVEYSDPYSRALYLHDELMKNLTYDNSGSLQDNQTIASAFINKKTVCAGYSRAFVYLCNAVGIDAISVFAPLHEWSMVRIGSEWYCVDVTYDDTQSSHKYFLCDYNSFQSGSNDGSHKIDSSNFTSYINLFPSCTASDQGKNALSWGDLNGDSLIDANDLELIKNPSILSAQQKAAADLDCNGTVDSSDEKIMSDYISGTVKKLPALDYPPANDGNFDFTNTGILGDVNGDTKVDSKDAVYILIDYANVLTGKTSSLNKDISDVNKDGVINSVDAVKILQYYANVLTDPSLKSMEDFLNGKR